MVELQDKKSYWEDAGIVEDGLKIDTNTETDGRYHSNWLNMMYSRLLVARQLLTQDGLIFISIDDNVVVSERNFTRLNNWLRDNGFIVEEVPYAEIAKQEGLLRCSTLPLIRD